MDTETTSNGVGESFRPRHPDFRANSHSSSSALQQKPYSPYHRGSPLPKRVACTHCRQSKLRCDSPRDPCSRCERLGLTCTKDTGYKRVNKKSKIDELEKNVQELRNSLGHDHPTSGGTPSSGEPTMRDGAINKGGFPRVHIPTPSEMPPLDPPHETSTIGTIESLGNPSDTSQSLPQESPYSSLQGLQSTYGISVEGNCRPKALKVRAIESTALANEQIDHLFQKYFEHFHTFFPLLDPSKSPDHYYDVCPLLFWTVIGVASRRFGDDSTLLSSLAKFVPKLVWEMIADTPLPYSVVQALLILCMWPFPGVHMWSDSSTTFSNIALNGAFHMGLHRPNHAQEFTRYSRSKKPYILNTADPMERRKIWAATNIVSQYMAINIGYPPTGCCFDWSIDISCKTGNAHTLSDDLRYHLMIQRFSNRMSKVMSANVSDPLGLPHESQHALLMGVLEHELSSLENQIWGNLSIIDRIYFRVVRLQLEIYHWLGPSSSERNIGILKSYATATTLIEEINATDVSIGVLSYGPIVYPRMMFTAGHLILKVINSSLSRHINIQAGATKFHSAVAGIRRYSVEDNDHAIRAANILADVWYHRKEALGDESQEPSLITRSRLSASLMYDCLWRWKEQCMRTESLANPNPGSAVWSPQNEPNRVERAPQPVDSSQMAFDWDLFDELSWACNFDIPQVPET